MNADQAGDTALLQTGQAAFLLQGTWVQPGFLKSAPEFAASGDLGYTTFPAVEGGVGDPANIVGNPSNFWSISADARPRRRRRRATSWRTGRSTTRRWTSCWR